MVVEEVISVLPTSVLARVEGLVTIFKFVGIAVIVYVLYVLVMGFFTWRRMKRMKRIEKKVNSIDKKLSVLLKDKKKKKKSS